MTVIFLGEGSVALINAPPGNIVGTTALKMMTATFQSKKTASVTSAQRTPCHLSNVITVMNAIQ